MGDALGDAFDQIECRTLDSLDDALDQVGCRTLDSLDDALDALEVECRALGSLVDRRDGLVVGIDQVDSKVGLEVMVHRPFVAGG